VVGHVAAMTGSASIVRNGVTSFSQWRCGLSERRRADRQRLDAGPRADRRHHVHLTASARLMLNDLTYEATSTSNSALFTLVQGAATFVAGQVAKTGDMKVGTRSPPWNRGTAVILDVSSVDGTVSIRLSISATACSMPCRFSTHGRSDRHRNEQRLEANADADRDVRGDRPGEQ